MSTDAGNVLRVDGVVDFMSAPDVQRAGVEMIGRPGIDALAVDLAGVTFIDSSGLSVLVYLKGRCDERRIALTLLDISPRVRSLIDSLGLRAYFDLPDRAD